MWFRGKKGDLINKYKKSGLGTKVQIIWPMYKKCELGIKVHILWPINVKNIICMWRI